MEITCPNCSHSMKLKKPKPGVYKPKCGKCQKFFALKISRDSQKPPTIMRLEDIPKPSKKSSTASAKSTDAEAKESSSPPARPLGSAVDTRDAALDATTGFVPREGSSDSPKEKLPAAEPQSSETQVYGHEELTEPANLAASNTSNAVSDDVQTQLASSGEQEDSDDADQTMPHASDRDQNGQVDQTNSNSSAVHSEADFSLAPTVDSRARNAPEFAGKSLGSYRLIRELGRGAMGVVYLAKQTTLNRNVALKTIQAQWAEDPNAIARFVREAYAAAQLTHHNVLQIYDMGADQGTHFFSMEFVKGESLAQVLEQQGKLPPEVSVSYILQAARGLQYAHAQGMVHRDVKPANILLSEQGVIKVADLGLVKTTASEEADDVDEALLAASNARVTMANSAMGTPAYMAPEQADDAAGVDHRADIYSLGCTLYVLLCGQPPFQGASALEVITKHKTEAIVRPERIDRAVPARLSEIVMRMVAKEPEDRYNDLGEVIRDLEQFAGDRQAIEQAHVKTLEQTAASFQAAKSAKVRRAVWAGLLGLSLLLSVSTAFLWPSLATGFLAMLVTTVLSYFVASGVREQTHLWDRTRAYLLSRSWTDWLSWGGGVMLAIIALWLFGWLLPWGVMCILGIGLGLALHFVLDAKVKSEREGALLTISDTLKQLRLRGLAESALHDFVAQYGGDGWEAFFEQLFGYEAKLAARQRLEEQGQKKRPKFRGWRDPIIVWLEARILLLREQKDREHLAGIEAAGLRAQGVAAADAKMQAASMASALIDHAAESRSRNASTSAAADPQVLAARKRQRMKAMLAEARSGKYASKRSAARFITGPLAFFLGGKLRFLAGCILLAGCLLWMHANGMLATEGVQDAIANQDLQAGGELLASAVAETKPLGIPVLGPFVSSFSALLAGLYLVLSSFFGGWKMTLFAIPAAAAMVVGPVLGMAWIGLAVGSVLALVGLVLGRSGKYEY